MIIIPIEVLEACRESRRVGHAKKTRRIHMRARWPVREKEINVHIYTNAITFSDDDESDDGLISDNMLIRENQRSAESLIISIITYHA